MAGMISTSAKTTSPPVTPDGRNLVLRCRTWHERSRFGRGERETAILERAADESFGSAAELIYDQIMSGDRRSAWSEASWSKAS